MKAQMEVTLQNGLLGRRTHAMSETLHGTCILSQGGKVAVRCKEAEVHFIPASGGQLGVD